MAIAPESLRYTPTHEWIRVEDGMAVMGITDFAVKLLTDIVFIALPQQGKTVRQSEPIGEIESVKAVSDLYAPVDGEIVETNQALPS
ncbi:MAG: glycine cleavage system protein H, partial [Planctomyces sp.]